MARSEENGDRSPTEEVKPYTLHVSSKYLDLTKQKLELTRLPHEIAVPKSNDWWEPKSQVEPLIDVWLEQYSWRDQEEKFNNSVPQFRTGFQTPNSESPVRIHFIHHRSPHANAVPLLLIPPFPFSNLALSHLIESFSDPDDAGNEQPFHVVIPSLPGLGFSDALPNNTPVIPTTAEMLDSLMKRLDYSHYVVTNSGASSNSPSEIDWRLIKYMSLHYQESCLGAHLISPRLLPPQLRTAPMAWAKWKIATKLHRPMLGYTQEDLVALKKPGVASAKGDGSCSNWQFGFNSGGSSEPNTLAYALCDSPTGLLMFLFMLLRVMGPTKKFSPADIITLTALIWLPGPEATLRYWAYCAAHKEDATDRRTSKPKVGMTVFLGDETGAEEQQTQDDGEIGLSLLPRPIQDDYSCPAWGNDHFNILAVDRVSGKPGLLSWQRPDVIAKGSRKLAKAILVDDKRMQVAEQPGTALLEQVVVAGGAQAPADTSGTTMQASSTNSPAELHVDTSPKPPKGDFLEPPVQVYGDANKGQQQQQLRPVTPPNPAVGKVSSESRSRSASDTEETDVLDNDEEGSDTGDGSPDTVIAVGKQVPATTS